MKNYFISNLTKSNSEIKESRANRLAMQAEMAQSDIVRTLKSDLLTKEGKLDDLEDLSPETTVSLKVGKDGFDAKKWVDDIHALKIDIANIKLELEIAESTYNKYFGETKLTDNAEE